MVSRVRDLLGEVRWGWSLACLVCICFCSVQLYQLLGEFVNPTRTRTYVEETQLQEIPIDIQICVTPAFNDKTFQELGYDSRNTYLAGVSKFNHTLVGWGGHTNESTALTTSAKQVLDIVRMDGIKHLKYVEVLTNEGNGHDYFHYNATQLKLTSENVLSDCHILKMRRLEQLTGKDIMWIGIQFDEAIEKNNFSVVLQFQGQTLASHRHIKRHKFYQSGDTVDEFSSDYIVQIKKRIIAEEDPSNTCRDYPNEDFATYIECDDKFMADTFKDITDGLNVTPPWLTDDFDSVTVTPVPYNSWEKYSKEGIYIISNN